MEFSRSLVESTFKEVVDKAVKCRSTGKLLLHGRCPICLEGKKKVTKRFYLYEKENRFNVICHNCGYSKSFNNFLKEKFPLKYDFLNFQSFDKLNSGNLFNSQTKSALNTPPEILPSQRLHEFMVKYFNDYCVKLSCPSSHEKKEKLRHYAEKILIDRNIPPAFIETCYVCYKGHYQWRIIIPFINNKGLYYNFQARDIHPRPDDERKNKKYIFANFDGQIDLPDDKIYNKYSVDPSKTVYVFEGIFKSLFVKNSIAMCNANVTGPRAEEIRKRFPKRVWILDSPWKDKTGLEATIKLLEMGETCFVMPTEHSDCKDMDELAKKLNVHEFSEEYILKNTFNGEMGLMRFKLMNIMSK